MSKEFKIGILTVVAGALLYYGFNFLRGTDLFSPTDRYYVVYPNVAGLNVSNPIYINGLPVGRVSGFQLQQNEGRIVVALDIDQGVFVGKSSSATLANDGLLGGKAIVLDIGESVDRLEVGDTLKSEIDGGILSEFEPVADNLNSTITKINDLLDQLNSTDLQGAVEELKYAIRDMRRTVTQLKPELNEAINEYTNLASSLNARVEEIQPILQKTDVLMDSLNALQVNALVGNLNETLTSINTILANLQSETGTVGKLMNNDSVYNNLNKLLVDLDKLIIHFDNYPKDFMKPLGRKNKKLRGVSQEDN